jgi:hypothetical protein
VIVCRAVANKRDIREAARLMLELYGRDAAAAEAARMVDMTRNRPDREEALLWYRIKRAIERSAGRATNERG